MSLTNAEKITYLDRGFVKAEIYENADMDINSTTHSAEIIVLPSVTVDGIADSDQIVVYRITTTYKNAASAIIGKKIEISETKPTWISAVQEAAIVD